MKNILRVLFFPLVFLGRLITGGRTIRITRTVGNRVEQYSYSVGDPILVEIGGGQFRKAEIVTINRRGRVTVRFEGGETGVIKKSAIHPYLK